VVTLNAFEDNDSTDAMYKKYLNFFSEVDDNNTDFDGCRDEVKKGSNMRADQDTYRQTINDNHAKQKQDLTDKENDVRQEEFVMHMCMHADSMGNTFTTYKEAYFDLSLRLVSIHGLMKSGGGPSMEIELKNALIELAAIAMKMYWEPK